MPHMMKKSLSSLLFAAVLSCGGYVAAQPSAIQNPRESRVSTRRLLRRKHNNRTTSFAISWRNSECKSRICKPKSPL